jgi:hypothetical protein
LSSSFGQEGLQPLTALTQLQLTGSSVRLSGLSALTALQELACEGYESSTGTHRYSIPWDSLKTLEVDLISAFPQLQRLTKLKLVRAAGSPAVVSHISALQSLQRLMVDKTSANSFPQLPQSLTHLHFMPAQPCSLTRSNAAGLSQLTALQYLGLSAQPFDMACLTSMRRLQKLKFLCAEVAPGQLQVISRLTGLTSFVISVTKPRRDASPVIISGAEAGALTSSSQLVRLSLSSETGRPLLDDCASLFPPGRQLQHLTRLRLGADFLQDAEAVEQAGVCCPNLRYAKFGKLPKRYRCYRWHNAQADEEEVNQDDEEAEDWLADGLSAMADGWKNLRMLRLNNPLQTVPGWFIWEALGKFSQLHDLRIQIELPEAEQPEEYDVVLLEGCKELRHLFIGVRADAPWEDDAFRSWRLHMKSTVRAAKSVCWLLQNATRTHRGKCYQNPLYPTLGLPRGSCSVCLQAAPGESPNVWSGLSNQLEWTDGRYYPSAEVGDV